MCCPPRRSLHTSPGNSENMITVALTLPLMVTVIQGADLFGQGKKQCHCWGASTGLNKETHNVIVAKAPDVTKTLNSNPLRRHQDVRDSIFPSPRQLWPGPSAYNSKTETSIINNDAWRGTKAPRNEQDDCFSPSSINPLLPSLQSITDCKSQVSQAPAMCLNITLVYTCDHHGRSTRHCCKTYHQGRPCDIAQKYNDIRGFCAYCQQELEHAKRLVQEKCDRNRDR